MKTIKVILNKEDVNLHCIEIQRDPVNFSRLFFTMEELEDLQDKCTVALETAAYEAINTNLSQA